MNLAAGSLDGDEPEFCAALGKIRDAARAHHRFIMGFGISPPTLRRRIEMGWSAFIIHGDIDAICVSAMQTLREYSDGVDDGIDGGEEEGKGKKGGRREVKL